MLNETQTQAAFVRYLLERGWDVNEESPDHTDVIATRGAESILAEVKGHTTSPGLDVDTGYGQLLRRMSAQEGATIREARYALVVPQTVLHDALRVPESVRDLLDVDIYAVDDLGRARLVE